MDTQRFDTLTRSLSGLPTRRAALRLLAGGLLGELLARRPAASAFAQRPDSDQDGLYDDDEVNIYGTKPDVYDTDGDGVGDGEEIYNRDQGLNTYNDPLTPEVAAGCPAGQTNCGAGCIDVSADPANCGACGNVCQADEGCSAGACSLLLSSVEPPILANPCAIQGMSDCDHVCVDLTTNPYHCGVCRNTCPPESVCQGGFCSTPPACPAGQTRCGASYCIDLMTDPNNCGGCGLVCEPGALCDGGGCFIETERFCGAAGQGCDFSPDYCCPGLTCAGDPLGLSPQTCVAITP
jgi:hypothetical protein